MADSGGEAPRSPIKESGRMGSAGALEDGVSRMKRDSWVKRELDAGGLGGEGDGASPGQSPAGAGAAADDDDFFAVSRVKCLCSRLAG